MNCYINLPNLSTAELTSLRHDIDAELANRDPAVIAQREAAKKWQEEYAQRRKEKQARNEKAKEVLMRYIQPGTMLKMTGCKDGAGLREFIRWDGDNLVCWQIANRRQWKKTGMGSEGHYVNSYTNTNIVTTHMPDKVREFTIDGDTVVRMSSLI